MPDDLILRETAHWLRYAREDYAAALVLQQTETPRHVCLLAQQSAEKAIKSVFAFLDMPIPRSHDLDLLKNLLPDDWHTKTEFAYLSELSFWAVESRYPGDLPEATVQDAEEARAQAESILRSVEADLRSHGYVDQS